MLWLLTGIVTIGTVEVMLRLPLSSTVLRTRQLVKRVVHVVTSRKVSDHWKEIVVPTYALQLFRQTAHLAFLMVVVVSPFGLACAATALAGIPLLELLLSMTGVLFSTVVALSYVWLRISSVRARL
jgi:hypothetical protein